MFEVNPKNGKAIERAWKLVEGMDRGDVVSHESLGRALGVGVPDRRYYALAYKVKRKLLEERGIRMVSVPLVGYELASAKGQLNFARGRVVQASRRLRDGQKTVSLLPDEDCDFTELRAKQAMEQKLSNDERAMRQEAQRMAFLMRPRDQQPRIAREDGEARMA